MKLLKKILKWSAGIITGLLILLFLLPFIFKGKIVQYVKNEVNSYVNAKVEFDGVTISIFKFFPNISLKLNNLTIVGKDVFEDDTLLAAENIFVGMNIKKFIFENNITIRNIAIENVKLFIKVLPDGTANYDIAKEQEATPADTTQTVDTTKIVLKKFVINDAKIVYFDMESDILLKTNDLDLKLTGDFSDINTNLKLDLSAKEFSFASENIYFLKNAFVNFKGEFNADLNKSEYVFKENKLKINDLILKFEGLISLPDDENIYTDVKFNTAKTDFITLLSLIPSVYKQDMTDIKTAGEFSLNGYVKGTYNENSIPAFDINLSVTDGKFGYKDLPHDIHNINFVASLSGYGAYDVYSLKIPQMHFDCAGNPFDLNLDFYYDKDIVKTGGNLNTTFDLSTVKDFYPLDSISLKGNANIDLNFDGTINIKTENFDNFKLSGLLDLQSFEGKFYEYPLLKIPALKIKTDENSVNIRPATVYFGKSDFIINGSIDSLIPYLLEDKTITGYMDIKSQYLDLVEIMDLEEAEKTTDDQQNTSSENINDTLAFELPANMSFAFNLNLKKVHYLLLDVRNLTGKLSLKNLKAKLDNLNFEALGGEVSLSGTYDATNYLSPKADLNYDMKNIDIQEIYKAFSIADSLAPILRSADGKISLGFDFNATLDYTLEIILKTLNAEGYIRTKQIGIQGSKIFGLIATATGNKDLKNPTLKNLNLSFGITNGNLYLPKTEINISGLEGFAEGSVNLDRTLDMQLGMKLRKENAGKVINLPLDQLRDKIMVIIQLGGTVDKPKIVKFKTNFTPAINVITNELSEKGKEYLENVKKQAEQIIKDAEAQRDAIINQAYHQADEIRKNARKQADEILDRANEEVQPYKEKLKNPVLKKWAQKEIDKILSKAQKNSQKIIDDANKQADKIINKARKDGDKIVEQARKRADKMIKNAEKTAKTL